MRRGNGFQRKGKQADEEDRRKRARARDTARAPSAGYTDVRTVKKIACRREEEASRSEEFGGPVYNTPEHTRLFGSNLYMYVLDLKAGHSMSDVRQ
jgi:hypothetical protein